MKWKVKVKSFSFSICKNTSNLQSLFSAFIETTTWTDPIDYPNLSAISTRKRQRIWTPPDYQKTSAVDTEAHSKPELLLPQSRAFLRINQAARDISEPLIPDAREVGSFNLNEFVDSSISKSVLTMMTLLSDPIRLLWVILARCSSSWL